MTKLTPKERQAIQGIIDSDYQDGENQTEFSWHPVWTWSANPFQGAAKKSFPGLISSLSKKGFVTVESGHTKNEDCVTLTQEGWNAFKAE